MFFLWFIFHVFFAFVIFFKKRLAYFLSIFVFLPIALVYLIKKPTYDLTFYYDYFAHGGGYLDPGFSYTILILSKMLASSPFLIHIAYQFISMILIYITAKKLFFDESLKKTNLYLLIPVIVCSSYTLFYLLGSQNNVRQYFAFIISFIGFLYLLNDQKIKSFLFFALSITFHSATILYFPLYILIKIFKNQKTIIYLISFLGGLSIYLILVTFLINHPGVQVYLFYEYGETRSGILKVILITLSIFVTNYIFKSCNEFKSENIKLLLKYRIMLFFYTLIFILIQAYELWTRIIFVFYFIDLLLISHIAFKNTSQKYRFSCALLILSYAIAPNAKNILSGAG